MLALRFAFRAPSIVFVFATACSFLLHSQTATGVDRGEKTRRAFSSRMRFGFRYQRRWHHALDD